MCSAILAEFHELATRWRADATRINRYGAGSLVASTLETAALDLESLLTQLEAGARLLRVADYAKLHCVTPQTVRNWIRQGELESIRGQGRARLIRIGAERRPGSRGRQDRV